MRTAFIMVFVFFASVSFNILNAQEVLRNDAVYKNIKGKTIVPFFHALKKGDVGAIKGYLAGDMYEKNKVLLEQNEEYPNFLKNFYHGAVFQVKKVVKAKEIIFVDVMVTFPGGYQSGAKLQLEERKSGKKADTWEITNLIEDLNY